MGHRDAYGRRLRWTKAQKLIAKMKRERTNHGGPSTVIGRVHSGMQQFSNPDIHRVPVVNSVQRAESNFFYPAINDKPMPWNYPIDSDPIIGKVNQAVRVKTDLYSLPQSIFEEIAKNLSKKKSYTSSRYRNLA